MARPTPFKQPTIYPVAELGAAVALAGGKQHSHSAKFTNSGAAWVRPGAMTWEDKPA